MSDGASAAIALNVADGDPFVGRTINGRFKIIGLIARGGMAAVYRAEQAPLGRICAVKVLKEDDARDKDLEFSKRFSREASTASRLTHPNTVTIFDYGRTDDGVYYMAMEYLVGQTLRRAIRRAGPFSEERAVHIARQICRALSEAHTFGVIHRDLKPANIFLVEHCDEVDFVKVLDFGLVKPVSETKGEELTRAGFSMGSPKYMAPERVRGDRVDVRADIYSLGIIMYEMIAGKAPFDGSSNEVLMAQVQKEALPLRQMNPKARVSTALEEIIARSMAKDPRVRFASMDEVLGALKRVRDLPPAARTIREDGRSRSRRSVPSRSKHRPSARALQRAPERGRDARLRLWALLSALAIGAVLAGLGMVRGRRVAAPMSPQPVVVAPTEFESTVQTAPRSAGARTADAPAVVAAKVHVKTDPPGATVKENGVVLCESTPCDVAYTGADADPLRDHRLTFTRQAWRSESRVVRVGANPVVVKLLRATGNVRADPSSR
jgi:eukaryotic-like serine/threonine-protein kinase